jgi:hypothetical protein
MASHTLFRDAQEDAKKHNVDPMNVFLYTKKKHEKGELVTMEAETFHRILPLLIPTFEKG